MSDRTTRRSVRLRRYQVLRYRLLVGFCILALMSVCSYSVTFMQKHIKPLPKPRTINEPLEYNAWVRSLTRSDMDVIIQNAIDESNEGTGQPLRPDPIKSIKAKAKAKPVKTSSLIIPTKGKTLTKSGGVFYFNGRKECWYSQRVMPGGGLKIPGRHIDKHGLIKDKDNYIVISVSDHAKGTILATSLGKGKVYDTGCAMGTTDIYTNW